MKKEQFMWTGNPFVDTGLCVIIARAKEMGKSIETISDLTINIIKEVVGDGSWLANINARLNSYTMVFGNNGPLKQTATNPISQLNSHKNKIEEKNQELQKVKQGIKEKTQEQLLEKASKKKEKLQKNIETLYKKQYKVETDLQNLQTKLEEKEKKAKGGFDRGIEEYKIVINTLIEATELNKYSLNVLCECCGLYRATSSLKVASGEIRKVGNSRNDEKMANRPDFEIGRDWFPLIGSFNDAQALPSASRSANICALCLLAVQFLPLGVLLLNGKLACFQTNDVIVGSAPIFQFLVEDIYDDLSKRLELSKEKVTILGTKEGTKSAVLVLVKQFETLQTYKKGLELPDYVSLNVWLFTNSGTSPDCEIVEIPSKAVKFLWDASRLYTDEIKMFIRKEGKDPNDQLLTTIQQEREYWNFFPRYIKSKQNNPSIAKQAKDNKGDTCDIASRGLFELYNKSLLKVSDTKLKIAEWIAEKVKCKLNTKKEEKKLIEIKKSLGDSKKIVEYYPIIRSYLTEFAENGNFQLDEYNLLFPSRLHPLKAEFNKGLRLIWFYLNQDTSSTERASIDGGLQMVTQPKVKLFASDIFEYFTVIHKWEMDKFKKRILERFHRSEISTWDIKRWFLNLAEVKGGYTNEDWDDLCRDDNGKNVTNEVIFQLRLELANLYRLAVEQKQKA